MILEGIGLENKGYKTFERSILDRIKWEKFPLEKKGSNRKGSDWKGFDWMDVVWKQTDLKGVTCKNQPEISKFEQDLRISTFCKIEILHNLDNRKIGITRFFYASLVFIVKQILF